MGKDSEMCKEKQTWQESGLLCFPRLSKFHAFSPYVYHHAAIYFGHSLQWIQGFETNGVS
jgi:hypothetical protein